MRALALPVLLLLLAPTLAGCLGADEDIGPNTAAPERTPIQLTDVPEDATLERTQQGLRLLWQDLELPFDRELQVPEGTTMVRATVEVSEGLSPYVRMYNADTGRRRCETPYYDAWGTLNTGEMSCAGLAIIDPLPATWRVLATAPFSTSLTGETEAPVAELVSVEFLQVPLDGLASHIDVNKLSPPTHELEPTKQVWIEAHDGAQLYAEVTVPKGEGPWPVIIGSSPYNAGYHAAGEPAMWEYFVQDWAKRGYAIVMADVRGFGNSGGCVEVWGENEQMDQVTLVDWAREQTWSNGRLGFYGQSYVGTTPVEAAVRNPEGLEAIISVAPVINAYDDWHFGGVPNGENLGSPVGYQAFYGTQTYLDMQDPLNVVTNNAAGLCDPALVARANDPRAIYDAFYEARNFSLGAGDVEAAVLYTHGFEDTNVKASMANHWFNALDAPKLGVFGHWVHQHPVRADQELLFLAWMDHYVKGKDLGLDDLPNATLLTQDGRHRTADAWPPVDPATMGLYPAYGDGELSPEPSDGSASIVLDPTGELATVTGAGPIQLVLEHTLEQDAYLSGDAWLKLAAELQGAENAHVAAFLYDGDRLVTFGMANLAHREGHHQYTPATPNEVLRMDLPFLPTEHVFHEGDQLRLVVRGAQVDDWSIVGADRSGTLTLLGGAQGVSLQLPLADLNQTEPTPVTAGR